MKDYVCYIDTDSVVGDTEIIINGEKIKIEDYFTNVGEEYIYYDEFNENYIKKVYDDKTVSVNSSKQIVEDNVKYVMKHKVNKKLYRLKVNGKAIILTEDHSLVVLRNNKLKSISPRFLKKTDFIITI